MQQNSNNNNNNSVLFPQTRTTRRDSMSSLHSPALMNTNNNRENPSSHQQQQQQQTTMGGGGAGGVGVGVGGLDHGYSRLRTRTMSSIATTGFHRDIALEVHELVYGPGPVAAAASSSSASIAAAQHQHQQHQHQRHHSTGTGTGAGGAFTFTSYGVPASAPASAPVLAPAATTSGHSNLNPTPAPGTGPAPPLMTAQDIVASLERLYEPNAVYENPLVTATSREMILDIHNLSRRIADVEIARPRALLAWLFGWRKPRRRPITTAAADNVKSRSDEEQALDEEEEEPAWFEALKCWSEIGDIVAESEGWDGTRRTVIEHTLHILLLPSLHTPAASSSSSTSNIRSSWTGQAEFDPHSIPTTTPSSTSSSSFNPSSSSSSSIPSLLHGLTNPVLTIRGISLPTPFHLQLRIITKLTFNEQGRVSAHRDFWDVKDLVGGLIPGARAAQWVLTRLAARGFATASWLLLGDWTWGGGGRARSGRREQEEYEREELLRTAAAVERRQYEEEEGRRGSATSLRGWPRFEMGTQQAPDTDLDTFDS